MDITLKQKSQSVVGLDIGASSVKCVEVTRDKDSFLISRASITVITDSNPETIDAALKTIFRSFQTPPKNIRISVSGPSILVRRVKLPAMTPNELKSAIRFEAEGHIPFPVDECVLEYQILGNNAEDKTMNVLLVAAKKAFVAERLKLFTSMDIKPELIDADILSFLNAFEILSDVPAEKSYGLLNIGHNNSSFVILHDKKPFFVREISCAGSNVTKALAALKSIEPDQAEKLKKEKDAVDSDARKEATRKGFEPLVKELLSSVSYFENELDDDLKTIWLSGGGALSQEAASILSEALGKKVALWDNKKKVQLGEGMDAAFFAQHAVIFNPALGLALRPLR